MFASHPPFQPPSPDDDVDQAALSVSPTTGRYRRNRNPSSGSAPSSRGVATARPSTPAKTRALLDLDLIQQSRRSALQVAPAEEVHTIRQLARRWDFWVLWWTFLLVNAGYVLFIHNAGRISAAWQQPHSSVRALYRVCGVPSLTYGMCAVLFLHSFQSRIFIGATVSQAVAALVAGLSYDRVGGTVSAPTLLVYAMCLGAWGFVILASSSWLLLGSLCVGASMGVVWCLLPVLVVERFGNARFGTVWGAMLHASGFGPLLLQPIQEFVYASHAEVMPGPPPSHSSETQCLHPACFVSSLLVFASAAAVATTIMVVISNRLRRPNQIV